MSSPAGPEDRAGSADGERGRTMERTAGGTDVPADAGDGDRDWLGDAADRTAAARHADLGRGADPATPGPVGSTVAEGAARAGETGDVLLSARGLQVHFPIRRGIVFDR
ncbi:MAG TPA: hypothetical protein VLM05_10185, partial [Mycobacteriales bacterium]|nr:hypothetical protein [Mycobacteriales bacterium]